MKVIRVNCCKLCPYFFFNENMIKEWGGFYSCDKYGWLGDGYSEFDFAKAVHPRCELDDVDNARDILPPEVMYPKVGIGVVVYHPEYKDKFLVGKRKGSHGAGMWALPGGHLDYMESPITCAVRECKEETGLVIKNPVLITTSNDYFLEDKKHFYHIWMKAELVGDPEPKLMEPEKCEGWEWMNADELKILNKCGEVLKPLYNLIKEGLI